MSNTITEYKSKTSLDNDVRVLWISTDMLALVPYDKISTAMTLDKEWVLIEGVNFKGGYLITDVETSNRITQDCYNARETNTLITFKFDNITIKFK